jgi:prophage antirepressor-like protein
MEFEGRFAFLNPEEVASTGISSPFLISEESVQGLMISIADQGRKLREEKADFDTFDHSAQCRFHESEKMLLNRRQACLKIVKESNIIKFSDQLQDIGPSEFLELTR